MFLKLTLCDNDEVAFYLNFDKVVRFYRCGSARNGWTDIHTEDGEVHSVVETCTDILNSLAEAEGRK